MTIINKITLARVFLRLKGYRFIAKNNTPPYFIALHKKNIIFMPVLTGPASLEMQCQFSALLAQFLKEKPHYQTYMARFDVLLVNQHYRFGHHIKNAWKIL